MYTMYPDECVYHPTSALSRSLGRTLCYVHALLGNTPRTLHEYPLQPLSNPTSSSLQLPLRTMSHPLLSRSRGIT